MYDIGDLLRATTKNIEEMKTRLRLVIEEIGDIHMKRLLKDLFNDPVFFGQYAQAPAAMSRHHNYAGGLLEHVLSLVDLAKSVTRIHPKLDPDLLVTGCILHDIGKLAEYKLGTTINYTNEGNLLGHISMGHRMVADRIEGLDRFPEVLAQKILHMILSHHGRLEWGSPVKPKFPGAIALHHIDHIDSTIKYILQNIENSDPENEWSSRIGDYGKLFMR